MIFSPSKHFSLIDKKKKHFSLSLSSTMADNYNLCLVSAMNRLWFHQIILFSEPISVICTTTTTFKTPSPAEAAKPISDSINTPSSNLSQTFLQHQEIPSDISSHQSTPPEDDSNNEESSSSKLTSSHSSLPTTQKQRPTKNKLIYSNSVGTLSNAMSCKSFSDLELEEVKGFMDLGFIFKKEQINPRMIRVLPGLQRLAKYKIVKTEDEEEEGEDYDDEIEEKNEEEEEEIMVIERSSKKNNIMRPYLSEAWLIRRPNSPLLNLKVPKGFAAADMKKHLRFWARTVASEIHQVS